MNKEKQPANTFQSYEKFKIIYAPPFFHYLLTFLFSCDFMENMN